MEILIDVGIFFLGALAGIALTCIAVAGRDDNGNSESGQSRFLFYKKTMEGGKKIGNKT